MKIKYIIIATVTLFIYFLVAFFYINYNVKTKINYDNKIMYTVYLDGEVNYNGSLELKSGTKLKDFIYDYLTKYSDFSSFNENELIENNKTYFIDYKNKININNASLKELITLNNVGNVRAQKIIDNRPYNKIEDILTNSVIGEDLYENIKNDIMV